MIVVNASSRCTLLRSSNKGLGVEKKIRALRRIAWYKNIILIDIVHTVRNRLPRFLVLEIVTAHFFRLSLRLAFLSSIVKVFHQLLNVPAFLLRSGLVHFGS